MMQLYWGCMITGMVFAVITLIFGDLLGDIFAGIFEALSIDGFDFLHPMVIMGGITTFGGSGILLNIYTGLDSRAVVLTSLIIAILLSVLVYFSYVKPMKNSENSIGFSLQDLVGKIGEVSVPVPADGFGEVIVRIGAGNTNQIAASIDNSDLPAGERVVVADVKDSVLYVCTYEDE